MNILFMSRLFYPHIGGVEKHVEKISLELIKKGHEVTVLTEKFDNKLSSSEVINKIRITRINPGGNDWFKKFRIWKNVWKNRKLIAAADIIHVHDVFFWLIPFLFFIPRSKIFVTFHGYEGNKVPGFRAKLMHKIAEKLSRGNICVGDFLKKWYGTRSDFVIYGGVDIPNSKFQTPNKYKTQNTTASLSEAGLAKHKILFLGRLEEETGIMVYLNALKQLKENGYRFVLTVLGDGGLREKAEKFVRENNLDVEFIGFVDDIDKFLQDSDLVFTSRYLGILEAMSYKKPVFAVYNNSIKKDYLMMAPFAKYISISKDSKTLFSVLEDKMKKGYEAKFSIKKGYDWILNQTWTNVADVYANLWRKY